MAKIVNPPAQLEPRPDDVDLPLHLLAKIAPFSQLKAAPSLDKYPGACRLRFFHAGEEVCTHGEPGWSAFCFVPTSEITAFRDFAGQTLEAGPANRQKTATGLAKAEADLQLIKQQLRQQDLQEKDKKELEKKLGSTEREVEKQQAALALLDEELGKFPEAKRRFDAWLHQHSKAEQDAKQRSVELPQLVEQARRSADPGLITALNDIPGATPARQRQLADLLEPILPELAQHLHTLASTSDGVRRAALTRLPRLQTQQPQSRGLLGRLGKLFGGKDGRPSAKPAYIPGDGPRDLDYRSRLCSIYEGELVGEISCLNRTPRSATITMARDGFVVELMRNILDLMSKDAAYLARVEAAQRQRLTNSALREAPLFADLPEPELARIASGMEFRSYEPGSLICDEHEETDCLYVIGNGIIKVVSGVSWLVPPKAAVNFGDLQKELTATIGDAAPPINSIPELNQLIADPCWREPPALRAVVQTEQLTSIVWRMLAAPEHCSAQGLVRCNRLMLSALDSKSYPALKPEGAGGEAGGLYLVSDFAGDWKKLCTQMVADDKKPDDPARTVWDRLGPAVQDRLRQGKTADLSPPDRHAVVAGLNELLRGELLLLTPAGSAVAQSNANLASQLLPMLAEGQLWSDFDFHRWNRCLNRMLLEKLCPKSMASLPRPSGLPVIRAYCSRNEILGEIGLVEGTPRSATLVTYNHPKNDPKREVGPVHLFRIGKAAIDEVLQRQPKLKKRLTALAAERRKADRQRAAGADRKMLQAPGGRKVDRSLLHSPRGEQLGLVEGQKLMLIDLDRCTRCDECVRACVETHDDQHSRLFLVGPRHSKYLVPATCRSCLDPVCMIGCPVNSIQRGDNKEILIRDWCIGCSKCADQCPYGSIQMHDTGLVAAVTHGWQFAPAPADEGWTQTAFDDRSWPADATPFLDDLDLELRLSQQANYQARGPIALRRTFAIAAADFHADAGFQLELATPGDEARVWLNGQELKTEEKPRQGKRKYNFGPARQFVKPGENVLAVWLPRPAQPTGQPIFTLRLDPEREADSAGVEIKLVTNRAVVCDLCSGLSTGPACVRACPHEAAMRVNAVKA